jgi:hypothetical protein
MLFEIEPSLTPELLLRPFGLPESSDLPGVGPSLAGITAGLVRQKFFACYLTRPWVSIACEPWWHGPMCWHEALLTFDKLAAFGATDRTKTWHIGLRLRCTRCGARDADWVADVGAGPIAFIGAAGGHIKGQFWRMICQMLSWL